MAEIRRDGEIIFVGDRVAIERGPARLRAKATPELLADDVTATHYRAPVPATEEEIAAENVLTKDGQRLFLDAAGKGIEIGKTMEYLDHLGTPGFYVMELADRPDFDPEKHSERQCWQERGFFPVGDDPEAAQLQALNLANSIAG